MAREGQWTASGGVICRPRLTLSIHVPRNASAAAPVTGANQSLLINSFPAAPAPHPPVDAVVGIVLLRRHHKFVNTLLSP